MKGKTFLCFSFRISVESTIRKISESTNNSSKVENHSSDLSGAATFKNKSKLEQMNKLQFFCNYLLRKFLK